MNEYWSDDRIFFDHQIKAILLINYSRKYKH